MDLLATGNSERFKIETSSSSARTVRRVLKPFVSPAHSFSREQQPVRTDEQLPTGLLDPAVPFVP